MESPSASAPLLRSFVDGWLAQGWALDDLSTFRMDVGEGGEGGEGAGDGAGSEGGEGGEGAGDGAGSEGGEGGDGTGAPETDPAKLQEEINKWKSQSRKHEDRAKANAKAATELAELKKSQMSDTDKAVNEAKDQARKDALAEIGQKLAGAEIKAALTGLVDDPASIVEDLNLAKYVDDEGEIDAEKIAALRAKYEAIAAKPGTGKGPDLKQGNRGNAAPGQLTKADLKSMSPEQIVQARSEGRLNDVLGVKST